jgi:hypothetical protein
LKVNGFFLHRKKSFLKTGFCCLARLIFLEIKLRDVASYFGRAQQNRSFNAVLISY